MKTEVLAVGFSYGLGSGYWLIAALRMEPAAYGVLMQWYGVITLVTAIFALRTHDYFFYLQASHGVSRQGAFRAAVRLEVTLFLLNAVAACLLTLASPHLGMPRLEMSQWLFFGLGLLSGATVLQGASLGAIRALKHDRLVVIAELTTGICWAAVVGVLLFAKTVSPAAALGLALLVNAVRSLLLVFMGVRAVHRIPVAEGVSDVRGIDRRISFGFLVGGQMTNILKNNILSLETLILGRLVPAEGVALFRVGRSLVNFSVVVTNISYQKGFALLSAAGTQLARRDALRQIGRISLLLWLISLPLIAAAALMFVWMKRDAAYQDLLQIVAILSLGMGALALQQAEFALLTLRAKFRLISIGFLCGAVLTALLCYLFKDFMSVHLFAAIVVIASFFRVFVMRRHALRELKEAI
jgi:O-antigen/teichoic acid export membrane protein